MSAGGRGTYFPRKDCGVRYAGGVGHVAAGKCCSGSGADAWIQYCTFHQPVHCKFTKVSLFMVFVLHVSVLVTNGHLGFSVGCTMVTGPFFFNFTFLFFLFWTWKNKYM